jgi:hypothetical protein
LLTSLNGKLLGIRSTAKQSANSLGLKSSDDFQDDVVPHRFAVNLKDNASETNDAQLTSMS